MAPSAGLEDSVKLTKHPSPVVRRIPWSHSFGSHVIAICEDGTVAIDGRVVFDTLPAEHKARALAQAAEEAPVTTGVLR